MNTQIVDTIIIGGGISGLAAGRALTDAGHNFLLITKEVGGRMLASKSMTVDYGASYITEDYQHVQKYVDRGDPLRLNDLYFFYDGELRNVFDYRTITHAPAFLKLYARVHDFTRRMRQFRERSLVMSQKDALATDPILSGYVKQPALDFVAELGLGDLHQDIFEPILHSTVFVPAKRVTAFYYLGVLAPLVRKTFAADYRHAVSRLTRGWRDRIIRAEVQKLTPLKGGGFGVQTPHGRHEAAHVILALPHLAAERLYPVPHPDQNVSMYTLHVVGRREEPYRDKKVVFFRPAGHEITILWRQPTGSDVIFSMVPNPDLDKYYETYRIVRTIHWPSALTLTTHWADQQLEPNLYLASDYNVCGLEDSFITGLYAARQILEK